MGATACHEERNIIIGAQVEFKYNGLPTTIHCQENDSMYKICNKFIAKSNLNEKEIYYVYDGRNIDKSLTFNQIANSLDKSRKKINVLVIDSDDLNKDSNIKLTRAKDIVCPKCYESIKMKINQDYKITLFECKNNHKIKDISLSEFENTQMINLKNIKCDICQENNKADTYNNEFYKCIECNKNICPLCKQIHNKNHNVYNYYKAHYFCGKHNEVFTNYCEDCNKNLCTLCLSEHSKHKMILLADLLTNKDDLMNKFNEFKNAISSLNNIINNMIFELNNIKETMSLYCKIKEFLITNYEEKERNYEILFNINELTKDNDDIITDICHINNIKILKDKISNLFDIYNRKFINEIKMTINFRDRNEIYFLTYNSIIYKDSKNELYINNKNINIKKDLNQK